MRRFLVAAACAALFASIPALADQRARRPAVSPDGFLRIDPVMFDLAARTGGEFLFWEPGEFGRYSASAMGLAAGKAIANRFGELPAGGAVEVEIEVPMVPKIGALRFYAGIQKKDLIRLIRPDARTVGASDPGVELVETRHMLVVKVSDPQPGSWTLAIAGEGRYQASARGLPRKQNYDELFFRFLRIGEGHGHPGLFPIDGTPAAGSEAICSATIDRDLEAVTFSFEGESGAVIEAVDLAKEERGPAEAELMKRANAPRVDDEFFGNCRVPRAPFRFVARGVDRAGKAYERRTAVMHPAPAPEIAPPSRE
jgi:hypothetical protein